MKRADKAEKEVEELVKQLEGLEPLVKAAQQAKNKGGQDGPDRKSVGEGRRVVVRDDTGGGRDNEKKERVINE